MQRPAEMRAFPGASGGGIIDSRRRFLQLLGVAFVASFALPARAAPERLTFAELYGEVDVLGLSFSERTKALAGAEVAMRGYMAPPLKADGDFFVLTPEPVALCPFCQSDEDWPADIVVVYPQGRRIFFSPSAQIEATGRLEIGSKTDERTGFVSLLRITEARIARSTS
jgi:hypothetical protein